jgi:hypothetical protein
MVFSETGFGFGFLILQTRTPVKNLVFLTLFREPKSGNNVSQQRLSSVSMTSLASAECLANFWLTNGRIDETTTKRRRNDEHPGNKFQAGGSITAAFFFFFFGAKCKVRTKSQETNLGRLCQSLHTAPQVEHYVI